MKKLFAFLLAAVMIFSLAACGSNEDKPSGNNDPGTSQNKEDGIDWETELYITNVTVPAGCTAKKVFYNKVDFNKDGVFTTDEKKEFLQMLWNACLEVSEHGIYSLDTSADTVEKRFSSLDEKLEDTYDWEGDHTIWYFTNKRGFWVHFDVYMGIDGEINVSAMGGRQVK